MSGIFVHGCGAVSPAGWGVPTLREALNKGEALGTRTLPHPGGRKAFQVRTVPPANPRPSFLTHPRLRRASALTQYAVGAAIEALGGSYDPQMHGALGIIVCQLSGCVAYSRRFYDEVLKNPGTASPLLFPETVFNAPASHIAAFLGTTAINYTAVGDTGTFINGLVLGAMWLEQRRVDSCLVVGTEELDWITAEALSLFDRKVIPSEGAGAVLLRNKPGKVRLSAACAFPFENSDKARALAHVHDTLRTESGRDGEWLLGSAMSGTRMTRAEEAFWAARPGGKPGLQPKTILGEGLMAASAWQCVAAIDLLQSATATTSTVFTVGLHQQAAGARFISEA